MAVHPFLTRLLRKAGASEDSAPTLEAWSAILRLVDRAFRDADSDRYTLERSIDISSTEMQGLYESVRRSAAGFRDLVEHLPDPTFVHYDGAYDIVYANSAMSAMLGYDTRELLGMRSLSIVHPDEHDRLRAYRHQREVVGANPVLEVRWVCRDGRVRLTRGISVPIRFDDKPATLVVARDITDEVAREAALRVSEERLRQAQKMEAIGQLAGGVAHDFNNILAAILANAELALDDLSDPVALVESLTEIEAAAKRAGALTRQLLAFSRKQKLQLRRLSLGTVVTSLQAMLRRLVGEDVVMSSVLDHGLGTIEADQGQLEQVIVNLVVNARDAMPSGGRLAIDTVATRLDDIRAASVGVPAGDYATLVVRDTGTGMTAAVRARIFDPFFTTKEVGKGTGLGLATVFGIVEQLRGAIEVESEVGVGTVFRIHLPIVEGLPSSNERRPHTIPPVGGGTVLVVEDDDQVRSVLRRYLRGWGYTLLEACNGPSALALADAHPGPIDLLLTDVVMPEMDGQTLANRLVARRPTTRVLFMSGYTEHPAIAGGFGANDLVHKPFTTAQLADAIRRALGSQPGVLRSVR